MPIERLLYVFDMDDTLIKSEACITYEDAVTGKNVRLSTAEYNKISHIIKEHPELYKKLSFKEFNDYCLLKNAISLPMYKVMKALYQAGQPVAILTSREDSVMVSEFFQKVCEIKIPESHIICINENKKYRNNKISDAELKKEAIIKLHKIEGYTTFIIYDDCDEFNTAMMTATAECGIHVIATSNFLTSIRE